MDSQLVRACFLSISKYHSSYHPFFHPGNCYWQETGFTETKTRDLKKIRDTKGTFFAKMGSIKDRNGMDLTEAEDIKKRWQEYTEELYKKDLLDQIIMMV